MEALLDWLTIYLIGFISAEVACLLIINYAERKYGRRD